jgi:hypothetical protein
MRIIAGILSLSLAVCAWGQAPATSEPNALPENTQQPAAQPSTPEQGPGKEIGSGAGTIGVGAAKGVGRLAKGTGQSALDLVTLHPINAAGALGKGALTGVQSVAEGTTLGGVKVVHGIGRGIKKLF